MLSILSAATDRVEDAEHDRASAFCAAVYQNETSAPQESSGVEGLEPADHDTAASISLRSTCVSLDERPRSMAWMGLMAERSVSIPIADNAPVSGVIHAPRTRAKRSGVAVVLGHGAGNDMNAPLVVGVAERLAARGHTVLRFNFVYKELGRKAPDRQPLLEKAYEAAIERTLEERPERLVIGGKSMGGRIASLLAARGVRADGLLFLGYPLHPAGERAPLRDAHLPAIPAPLLFVQGTRDPLCDLALLRPVLKRLGDRATLHEIAGGDHSLDLLKSAGRTRESVLEEVDHAIDGWLKTRVCAPHQEAR